MGKRSDYGREKLDFYPSPYEVVLPLLPYLPDSSTFCEPCAGDLSLVRHLEKHGHTCVSAFDVEPRAEGVRRHDASFISYADLNDAQMVITNPPWDRKPLHQIIERCAIVAPTWLLFDADWMHTKQAQPHLDICQLIIAVGRVKWIEGSSMAGKDNCCWYLFDARHKGPTVFRNRR